MTYAGNTPLVGGKLLNSKAFYGGIGAQVQEMFSVYEMEKDETSFFASTTPYNPKNCTPCGDPDCPGDCHDNSLTVASGIPRANLTEICAGANCTPE